MSGEQNDGLVGSLRRMRVIKIDDSGTQQLGELQGLKHDRLDKVVWLGRHGFASNPPVDSEGVLLSLGGRSDRAMFMGGEHREHRPKSLPPGASALYDAYGKILKSSKDKTEWDAGAKPWELANATTIKINAKDDLAIGVDGRWIRVRAGRIDIGVTSPTGEATPKVMTDAGPSSKVFAVI